MSAKMLDLYEELQKLLDSFDQSGIEYALCGGLAMAVYGLPRATVDIDVLLREESVAKAKAAAKKLGYIFPASPMHFASGKIVIERVSRIDSGSHDVLTLDMLVVTPATEEIWKRRRRAEWERGQIWVVSKDGLIALKRMRLSGQDRDDIERLSQ